MSNQDQPQNEIKQDPLNEDITTNEPQGAAEPQGNPTEADEGDLAAELDQLQAELAEAKEQALRAAAEMQNVRRRAEQDVERAHKFALEKFVGDLLPVTDNLQRAIECSTADGADMASVTEGVELTLKSLLDALGRHNVVQVNPEGEPFNPEFHQAMTVVPQPDVEPNTVINVYQCGYTLNGRLVRPAMVVVSKVE